VEWDTSLHTLSNGKTESGVSNLEISKNLMKKQDKNVVFSLTASKSSFKNYQFSKYILSQKDD
jgi:hypothetical protein